MNFYTGMFVGFMLTMLLLTVAAISSGADIKIYPTEYETATMRTVTKVVR